LELITVLQEDDQIIDLVKQHGAKKWSLIASFIPGPNWEAMQREVQCTTTLLQDIGHCQLLILLPV